MNIKDILFVTIIISTLSCALRASEPSQQVVYLENLFTPVTFGTETKQLSEWIINPAPFGKTRIFRFSFSYFDDQSKLEHISQANIFQLAEGRGFYLSDTSEEYGLIAVWDGNSNLLDTPNERERISSILLAYYAIYKRKKKRLIAIDNISVIKQ